MSSKISGKDMLKDLEFLEKDMAEVLGNMEKKPYTDGWPEDKWKEEIEKYPIFMQNSPNPDQELPPLLQGLQQIKYDTNENSPEELADTYKTEGNWHYSKKLYEKAIINYKEGLKQNCSDKMKAILYNNCAAAHYALKNYRSALDDSRKAVFRNSSYSKAKVRISYCLFNLRCYDDCIKECQKLLSQDRTNSDIIKMRIQALIKKEEFECERRSELLRLRETKNMETKLINAIRERNITTGTSDKVKNGSQVGSSSSGISPIEPVSFNENGLLVWSVRFLYPEYGVMETVKRFVETETFYSHLEEMFSQRPSWDLFKLYRSDNINLYYTNKDERSVKISVDDTLLEVIQKPDFVVLNESPLFFGVLADSESEEMLVKYPLSNEARIESDNDDDDDDKDDLVNELISKFL